MKIILLLVVYLVTFFPAILFAEEELIQVNGVIHLNTDVSSGCQSPERCIKAASDAGIKTVFLTENLKPKWVYGLYPFRGIIKRTVEKPGLLEYGTERYSKRTDLLNEKAHDMTVLMSAEVAPFYYWTGHPLREGSLTLNDWDLQFLVMGLEPEDYKDIPTISTGGFYKNSYLTILMMWPFILIIAGIVSLKWKSPRFFLPNSLSLAMIFIGVLCALHNYPYKVAKYDQYHGNRGAGPYQAVIDYVNSKGGMTFWSSPEAKTHEKLGPAVFISPSAEKLMIETRGYTGFCCFYEGYRGIGGPGGIWDAVLEDYCAGARKKPVWAIGEMSYHGDETNIKKPIDEVRTVFLVPANTREDILDAMREGSMYAVRQSGKLKLKLDSFRAENTKGEKAGMGQELVSSGPVTVRFKVDWKGSPRDFVSAKLIRNGIVAEEFFMREPGAREYKDDLYQPGKKIYYRLDVRGKYPAMLFSNPIFVEFK